MVLLSGLFGSLEGLAEETELVMRVEEPVGTYECRAPWADHQHHPLPAQWPQVSHGTSWNTNFLISKIITLIKSSQSYHKDKIWLTWVKVLYYSIYLYICCLFYMDEPMTKLLVFACVCALSRVQPSATPSTVARQAPLSMEFSRQELWSGLPFSTLGNFLTQGSNTPLLCLLDWQAECFPLYHLGSSKWLVWYSLSLVPF